MTNPYPDFLTQPAVSVLEPAAARRGVFGPVFVAVLVGVIVAATGLLVGYLWAEIAPRVGLIKAAKGFVYADPEPEQAVAADGWFAILGLAAGLMFAVLAWTLLRRYRGVAVMVGLAVGSLVAAYLAWWIGHKIGMAEFAQVRDSVAVGTRVDAPLGLRLTDLDEDALWPPRPTGVAAIQALVAAAVYTTLAGFSRYSNLRGPDRHHYPSWPGGDQFGPGFTGNPDTATGTART